jgi:MFS family permease
MLAAPLAYSVPSLAAIRLFTGLGIGGMLAATNAVAAEYTNARWRTAGVALMAAGYPLGAIVGGTIASKMLVHGNWRDVFYLGAGLALILLPIVPLLMPEPVGAILHRRPAGALEKINRTLRAFGHAPVDAMPPIEDGHDKNRIADLFSPQLIAISLLLLLSYFSHILTFYFVLKWAPKIVVGMGFTPAEASGVLVLANVGGLIGAIIFSLAALRVPLRSALIVMMVASTVLVALFGQSPADLSRLSLAAAAASFCTNGVIVGFYALIAQSFPTPLRGTGTGFVIGVGRLGAAAGPIIAGYLFEAKLGLPIVAIFMSVGSLAAAAALFMMPHRENVAH